ncbi:rRNA maturation RNase YbeY [Aestuariibius sp. HNIBRBA575]|uniref:rRNA maturation RNase YbeY n=1 Tax=Aestuariibius sp. HNIBRBA575 TaxID=3233343 RepID=UPI0034A3E360
MAADILIEDPRWRDAHLDSIATQACVAALTHIGLDENLFEVSVLACSDSRIAELNSDFRGKPRPTNVLSWPSAERGAEMDGGQPDWPSAADSELGDIAIAFETCQREAAEADKSMHDHVTHLIVHGVLHLLGYDHERDLDATLMERLEQEILGKLGIKDPYRT